MGGVGEIVAAGSVVLPNATLLSPGQHLAATLVQTCNDGANNTRTDCITTNTFINLGYATEACTNAERANQ